MVAFRDIDEQGEAFTRSGQGQLLTVALELADQGASQEEISAELERRYPGKPSPAYYGNPAAEAVYRRVRKAHLQQVGLAKDIAKLRAEGKPEDWAYKQLGIPIPSKEPEIPERPPWTDSDDPAWRGPLHTEVQQVGTAGELLALCTQYNLHVSIVGGVDIQLSQRIAKDSDLFFALKRFKPEIMAILQESDAPSAGSSPRKKRKRVEF